MSHEILPLKYKWKIWNHNWVYNDILEKYLDKNYVKNKLEWFFSTNSENPLCFKNLKRVISLRESIEIEDGWTFIKFRYWQENSKDENWSINLPWNEVDWWMQEFNEYTKIPANSVTFTDFFCAIKLKFPNLKNFNDKWFEIDADILIIKKWNEHMKSHILKLIKDKLFSQDDDLHKSEHLLDFIFTEEEIESSKIEIKKLELITDYNDENLIHLAGDGKTEKKVPVKITIWWNNTDILDNIKDALGKVFPFKKRAIIKVWNKDYTSDFKDNFKLALKSVFLYWDDSISYEKFKEEVKKF